jgi:N-acyl homoserine lactone hydrolase
MLHRNQIESVQYRSLQNAVTVRAKLGDAAHFRENLGTDGVPAFNFDRAQSVASLERIKKIVSNLKATVTIQHDARDVDKLPVFPASAK